MQLVQLACRGLAEDLARAEEQVTRLAITREEVTRVLEEPATAVPPGAHGGRGRRRGGAADGAEAVLTLRAVISNGDFEE
jgi:hypothetical protein